MPATLQSPGDPGLCSLRDVRLDLFGDAEKATTYDDLLREWILAESRRFEADRIGTGQPIRRTTKTYEFTGNGTSRHTLSYHPVSNLSAMTYRESFDTWSAVPQDFEIGHDEYGYFIDYNGTLSSGTRYRATFQVGYTDVPDDISALVKDAVILRWKNSPRGEDWLGRGTVAESGAAGTQDVSIDVDPTEHDARWSKLIRAYRRYR